MPSLLRGRRTIHLPQFGELGGKDQVQPRAMSDDVAQLKGTAGLRYTLTGYPEFFEANKSAPGSDRSEREPMRVVLVAEGSNIVASAK